MARLVPALNLLRYEFDLAWPGRDKTSDGWIGDAAHQAGKSDHNPDADGWVHAIDVDKDGIDMWAAVTHLVARARAGTERRLSYIIWSRTIWSASYGWKDRVYTGSNPHTSHGHFSAVYNSALKTSVADWGVRNLKAPAPPKPSYDHRPGSRVLWRTSPVMTGDDVRFVQRWIGPARCGAPDGKYGPKTEAGVRWYQGMRKIAVDGVCGPQTWAQMGVKT